MQGQVPNAGSTYMLKYQQEDPVAFLQGALIITKRKYRCKFRYRCKFDRSRARAPVSQMSTKCYELTIFLCHITNLKPSCERSSHVNENKSFHIKTASSNTGASSTGVKRERMCPKCQPNVTGWHFFFMPHYELKAKLWRASNVNENTSFHMKTAIGSASFNQKHLWIFKKELIPQASSESSPLIIEDTLALTSVTIHMVKQLLQFDQHVLKPIYHVVQPFTICFENYNCLHFSS